MTQAAFYDDPYRKSMDATVVAVDGAWVVLDASIFYPEGGGQPGDSGELSHADGRCWTPVKAKAVSFACNWVARRRRQRRAMP